METSFVFRSFLRFITICSAIALQAANMASETSIISLGGIGTICQKVDNDFIVISINEGSPAYKAGILVGDIISAIDNRGLSKLELEEVSAAIRGDVGTKVILTILRNGNEEKFDLVRERVVFPMLNHY